MKFERFFIPPLLLIVCALPTGDSVSARSGRITEPQLQVVSEDLDKEFYNDYLDSLPDERILLKKTLERNLLRVMIRTIPREDPGPGDAYIKIIQQKDLAYKQVTLESPFIRGLIHELPYIKPTEYMWIIKSGPYLLFVSFKEDPRRYLLGEFQTRLVVKKNREDRLHPEP